MAGRPDGLNRMVNRVLNGARRYPQRVGRGMFVETEIETKESKKITPVASGNLKGSIHTEGPEFNGNAIKTSIVAGGPAAPYAAAVHEDPEALHKNGEWKYIETPVKAAEPYFAGRVARRANLEDVL